jgi:hypothetical protein
MSHPGYESIFPPAVEALHPGTPAPPRLSVLSSGSISSGGGSYSYRGKVGFAATSADLPPRSDTAPASEPAAEHAAHDEIAWIVHLPHDDLQMFLDELRVAVDVGDRREVLKLLEEWKVTAEAYEEPELLEALTSESNDDFGPVPDPRMTCDAS